MAQVQEVDQARFQQLLASDPDIQAVIKRVWGDVPVAQRPGDTPKNLEKANDQASKEIMAILKAKGVQLPPHTFINPRTSSLEAQHGWAGLPTGVKIAIIAGAAATGIGAAGAMGAFGGTAATAGGAGSGAAGGAGAATGGTLASTSLASSVPMIGSAAATGGNLAAGAGSTIGGLMSAGGAAKTAGLGGKLVSGLMKPDNLKTIGTALGAVSKTSAANRGTELDAMMEADKMRMAQAGERRADESDLWRKLQAADYMKSGGMPKKPAFSSTGTQLPEFGFGPAPISQANKDMASTLEPQLQARLKNPPQLSDYGSKMKPSGTEKTLNWLGPLVGAYGMMKGGK